MIVYACPTAGKTWLVESQREIDRSNLVDGDGLLEDIINGHSHLTWDNVWKDAEALESFTSDILDYSALGYIVLINIPGYLLSNTFCDIYFVRQPEALVTEWNKRELVNPQGSKGFDTLEKVHQDAWIFGGDNQYWDMVGPLYTLETGQYLADVFSIIEAREQDKALPSLLYYQERARLT